ncbi:MAG: ferric reductase-like transmembrane domain-containing protein [Gammaproteobacteria bacterium]|nr:ferric reductase-like transmembrane domain-containing protein [Gammaproteobacteria bacterium]
MSHAYVAVNWNRRKVIYDACVWAGIAAFVGVFVAASFAMHGGGGDIPGATAAGGGDISGATAAAGGETATAARIETTPSAITIWMRALAACGFWMLTVILCIGPLARLDRRFLPLLYNRRHFGVSLFAVALIHGALAVYWYHSFGVLNPIVSVFTSGGALPFQAFGAVALALLFLLAATSHDYWNAALGATWKALHMLIYPAYALVIAHIALQGGDGLPPAVAVASVLVVGGLHLAAAFSKRDGVAALDGSDAGWVDAGDWRDIPDNRARMVTVGGGERIALFRYAGKLAAVSNVCRHQAGPLGEGRVVDGLITCPWHGYQYRPEDGCSPPPFAEKIATYRLKVERGRVWLDPNPLPAGAARPVVTVDAPEIAGPETAGDTVTAETAGAGAPGTAR